MATWIALIRGINVGGKNMLPMSQLAPKLGQLNFSQIKTYLQSGNIIFESSQSDPFKLGTMIEDLIVSGFHFRPFVQVLSRDEMWQAFVNKPFELHQNVDGKLLHLFFLEGTPVKLDEPRLNTLKSADEVWKQQGKFFYLYTPGGFHKSKLGSTIEKILGVRATARNWRTVGKILELADSLSV